MFRSLRSTDSLSLKPLSSFLLGTALAVSLSHAHLESFRNGLTAFGWALVAALGGTLVYTLMHWSTLVNAALPNRNVWQKSIFAGILIAFGLLCLGSSIQSEQWTPFAILPLTLIPWAVKLWRVLLKKDVFDNTKEKLASLYLLTCCVLIVLPEISVGVFNDTFNLSSFSSTSFFAKFESTNPRLLALLGALSFAAASSLTTAQQRKISTFVYWSIPCAVASVVLSLFGWASIHILNNKHLVNALVDTALPLRASHAAPAIIFGVAFLTLRPKIQVHNTLHIGKVRNTWWQQLGLLFGFSMCLLVTSRGDAGWYDFLTTLTLIAGFSIDSKSRTTQGRVYSTISVVERQDSQQAASGS